MSKREKLAGFDENVLSRELGISSHSQVVCNVFDAVDVLGVDDTIRPRYLVSNIVS
jgi:hypothetical protein